MPNFLSSILRPVGLDPSQGYDTAAAGARDAQGQANALSDLQWQRQMQGLGQAQGFTGQLQALYNSMYSPGGGAPAAGGMQMQPMGGAPPAAGASMLLPQQKPPSTPAGGSPGLSSLLKYSPAYSIYESGVKPVVGATVGAAKSAFGALKDIF
jgi:hypothetical protein